MHLNIRPFDARVQSVRVPSFEIDGLTPSSSRGFMGGAHVSIPSPPRALIALRALQATTPFPIRSNASSLLEYDSRWKRQLALRPEPTPVPSASISSLARQSSYGDAVLRALVNFNVVSIKAPDFFERRCIWLAEILRSVRGANRWPAWRRPCGCRDPAGCTPEPGRWPGRRRSGHRDVRRRC